MTIKVTSGSSSVLPVFRDQTLPLDLLPISAPVNGTGTGTSLRHFRYQLERGLLSAALAQTPNILGIGDSIMFGSLATTRPRSYWEVARTEFNKLCGITTLGDGHIRLASTAFGNPKWAISVGAPVDAAIGFGQMAKTFAVADAMTFTGTFRRFILNYQVVNGSAATLRIADSINGVLQAGLSMGSGAGGYTTSGNSGIFDSGDLGASAARTITITCQVAPLTVISGYFMANVVEVLFWNGGVSGQNMNQWLTSGGQNDFVGASPGLINLGGLTGSYPEMVSAVIEMGTNDGIQGRPVFADFSAAVNDFRNRCQDSNFASTADGLPASVIFTPPAVPNAAVLQPTWRGKLTAPIYQVASVLNCDVIDLGKTIGTSTGDISFGLHPNDIQHSVMGKALAHGLWQAF